jgi:hypothetical protein
VVQIQGSLRMNQWTDSATQKQRSALTVVANDIWTVDDIGAAAVSGAVVEDSGKGCCSSTSFTGADLWHSNVLIDAESGAVVVIPILFDVALVSTCSMHGEPGFSQELSTRV